LASGLQAQKLLKAKNIIFWWIKDPQLVMLKYEASVLFAATGDTDKVIATQRTMP